MVTVRQSGVLKCGKKRVVNTLTEECVHAKTKHPAYTVMSSTQGLCHVIIMLSLFLKENLAHKNLAFKTLHVKTSY